MTALVAIDLALDRLFEYSVPEALEKKLAIGQLLCIPFGHRQARGFVMAIRREAAPSNQEDGKQYTLKPVSSIVDEVPFFSASLLELVKKIASLTVSPIESVLRSAVPAAVVKSGAREKTQLYVSAVEEAVPPEGLPEEAAAESRQTSRRVWLCGQIRRVGGGWLNQICKEFKTTPATLRQMVAEGMLRLEPLARRRNPIDLTRILPSRKLQLNPEQAQALDAISRAAKPVLLFGVTGSGKTEVYLQAIERELESGRGAIVMVPEISLTPQTMQRFASRFGKKVAVLHSALNDGERYDEWHRIRNGDARVVVGPRSAVFAPVRNLGLIVVDEEHDASYKQENTPRYNARDVAVMRAALEHAKVVLGSATPSLESWLNARNGKYELASMRERAGAGRLPAVGIVDMGCEKSAGIFSGQLLDAIASRLDRGEQTILLLNRRGYSRSLVCEVCAQPVMCPDCSMAYTYHRADECLRCHICGGWRELPARCPACGSKNLTYKGIGTQRAEAVLQKCFAGAKILRMDADSTSRRHSHDEILGMFRRGEAQILLGTQMIAKGLDFPNVTLVGVLNADSALNMPDFRATERAYQLLSQVAGRAGRAGLPGEVFIQTRNPDYPAIIAAAKGDFAAFAREELESRKEANLPPYCKLAAICVASRDNVKAAAWAQMYAQSLESYSRHVPGFFSSEAYPSALEKAQGWFRWQIVLRSGTLASLAAAWKWLLGARPIPKEINATIDMNAYSIV